MNEQRPTSREVRWLSCGGFRFGPVLLSLVLASFQMPASRASEPRKYHSADARIATAGESFKALRPFDDLMREFVRRHDVPGAALAVAKDGRLIYARGFGFADVARKQAVQPESRFRIASISKPMTAVAILKLAQQGKFKLDDGVLDHLPKSLLRSKPVDGRWNAITLRRLLNHSGGFDRDASFDPMFRSIEIAHSLRRPPPAGPDEVIRYMLKRRLDFDPGTKYAYSNFGYCLLGRVIEKHSGSTYEQYVKQHVLKPVGVTKMRIGRTPLKDRATGEVRYYMRSNRKQNAVVGAIGRQVDPPYGAWYLEAMDAHGGWIGSAVDLVRFASSLDTPRSPIPAERVREMFAPPAKPLWRGESGRLKPAYYSLGWMVRPVGRTGRSNNWHTGSLDGTSTILVRRHDGLCWAVLFNTRETLAGKKPAPEIDSLVHKAASAVENWPTHDLFGKFK